MTVTKLGYTAAQIRAAEGPLLERGVPLMARAATALADHAMSLLPVPTESRVLVLAGAGDNGGDALYAAATLARAGVSVEIAAVMGSLHEESAAAAFRAGVTRLGDADAPVNAQLAASHVAGAEVVIDGVLGIGGGGVAAGGSPALRGPAREVLRAVKTALANAPEPRPLVIAVDIPSGVDPDDGGVAEPDAVLAADLTVSFIGFKAGTLLAPGAEFTGKLWLEPIGASQALLGVEPAVRVE